MAYDINAALERLEQNLQDLDSAREQVEKTVTASTELQQVVSGYVSSVRTLCVGLQAWEDHLRAHGESLSHDYEVIISKLNSSCDEIINSFKTVVDTTGTDFKTKTDSTIQKFTAQNAILTERVQDLNALKDEIKKATAEIQVVKESLTQISKDLGESQKQQDVVLGEIKQMIAEVPVAIKGYTDGIIEKLAAMDQGMRLILDGNASKIDLLNEKTETLKTTTTHTLSALKSSTESLTNAIKTSNDEIKKSNNINRWILIIGIILLAALHFLV